MSPIGAATVQQKKYIFGLLQLHSYTASKSGSQASIAQEMKRGAVAAISHTTATRKTQIWRNWARMPNQKNKQQQQSSYSSLPTSLLLHRLPASGFMLQQQRLRLRFRRQRRRRRQRLFTEWATFRFGFHNPQKHPQNPHKQIQFQIQTHVHTYKHTQRTHAASTVDCDAAALKNMFQATLWATTTTTTTNNYNNNQSFKKLHGQFLFFFLCRAAAAAAPVTTTTTLRQRYIPIRASTLTAPLTLPWQQECQAQNTHTYSWTARFLFTLALLLLEIPAHGPRSRRHNENEKCEKWSVVQTLSTTWLEVSVYLLPSCSHPPLSSCCTVFFHFVQIHFHPK